MEELEAERLSRDAYLNAQEKTRQFISGRKVAYAQVFNPENVFVSTVFKDLAKFCRANSTTLNPNPYLQAALEGRREVWLRIQQHLKLSQDDLFKILGGS